MKITKLTVLIFSLVLIYGFSFAHAGSLSPSASPTATFHTLEDIYLRLTTNATSVEGDHDLSTTTVPVASFYTLEQIYDAIPTIDATKVAVGTTYLGVSGSLAAGGYTYGSEDQGYVLGTATGAGTVFVDMFNGSGVQTGPTNITGETQADGGLDDYNNGDSPATGRYEGSWTVCNVGNSYCGTSDTAAKVKDNQTGLIWSYNCGGLGCSTLTDDSVSLTYSWTNGGANNNLYTAQQLCTSGDHGKTGWYLPHQKQMLQAYINGAYGNILDVGTQYNNWSATEVSSQTRAWVVNLGNAYGASTVKTALNTIRCVRSS